MRRIVAVLLITLCCTGCVSVIEPSPKIKVAHSPLPGVTNRAEGIVVVLREEKESYERQRRLVGGQVLSTKDLILLFIPTAHPRLCYEIEGRQSLNQVLTAYLAEALTHAGYSVRVQEYATRRIPKKWREVPCILEFALVEFAYEDRDSGSRPNSHTIILDLQLFDQQRHTALWQRRYRSFVESRSRDAADTIRDALDKVLTQVFADASSEELQTLVKSGRLPTS